jgi:hypothetical protein
MRYTQWAVSLNYFHEKASIFKANVVDIAAGCQYWPRSWSRPGQLRRGQGGTCTSRLGDSHGIGMQTQWREEASTNRVGIEMYWPVRRSHPTLIGRRA